MEGNIEIINNSECTISELHNNNKHEGNRYVLLNNYNTYHTISEKLFSILTHVFIMVCFATYFFFEYVIEIEKKLLLDKIKTLPKKKRKCGAAAQLTKVRTCHQLAIAWSTAVRGAYLVQD